MRRIVLPILSLLAVACTKEIDDVYLGKTTEEIEQTAKGELIFEQRSFSIAEHSKAGSSIGFLKLTDTQKHRISYSLESDTDIDIDENTGELKVGARLDLDFERTETIPFSVSAFDGETLTEKSYELKVKDVDETTFLTGEEWELIDYFQYLTLWKGPGHSPKDTNRKWGETMKLHLAGTISESFKASVERVIAQYNELMAFGNFKILLTTDTEEANAHLFYGNTAEVKAVWPDMHKKVMEKNYDGYAMTPSENDVLHGTRIWLSNPLEALFKHELGHALGLGHSNKCEEENSFLCSKIKSGNDISPVEQQIIRYLYHPDMPAGLSESEMETVLANLIVGEK